MYLEISGRQTQKTQRLIAKLDYHLASNDENIVCLTLPNMKMADNIIREINPAHKKRLWSHSQFKTHEDKLRGLMELNDPRILFMWDEFDFIHDIRNVPVHHNGYYCTTPKFKRETKDWVNWKNDPLLRLLIANNFQYVTYHGMKMFFDNDGNFNSDLFTDSISSFGFDKFSSEFMTDFNGITPSNEETIKTLLDTIKILIDRS